MCSLQCGMKIHIADDKIVKIEGEEKNPNSLGKLCAKGLLAAELEYDPNRLKYPLKRVGEKGEGKWERITWNEALDIIHEKLVGIVNDQGPDAIAWHRGTAPRWGSNWKIIQRFMNVLGSSNLCTHDHICHTPREMAYQQTMGKMPVCDFEGSKCIVLWGSNPVETSLPIQLRQILEAKEKGAILIVIDPRFTKTASKADIYVQLRPGTDGALALGMMNVIIEEGLYDEAFVSNWTIGFEELKKQVKDYSPENVAKITDLPKEQIIEISRVYATTKPASILEGNGLDQHTNVVQSVRALACLMSITGNVGIPGGNIIRPSLGIANLSLRGRIENAYERSISNHPLYYNEPRIGLVSTIELIDSILTEKPYPIKALVVQASSIGVIESNTKRVHEALRRVEFLVVHDLFMTAAAELADIVLPASTFLEEPLLITQTGPSVDSTFIGMINKVVEPLGESWSDAKFIFELARRLGYEEWFPWVTEEETFNEELKPLGLSVDKIRGHPEGILITFDPADVFKSYENIGFKTPSGKVELYSNVFEDYGYDPLPIYKEPAESPTSNPSLFKKYPLICSTGLKSGLFTHTRYRTLPGLKGYIPASFALIHPNDAKRYGVTDGEIITLESERGRIATQARVTMSIKKGVVMVSHGGGQPYAGGGTITNTLTDDMARCPISASTGNRSFLCRILRK